VAEADHWWRTGVIYQIYPRSFADSNGDGIGDLPGILGRLDHLTWLGVDAIWLNPTMPSPNADWGYDVSDYLGVHPDFGTPEDLDRLIAEAGRRGIQVLLDLVPNHTSDEHPWFVDSRSGRGSEHRDWYVWADGRDGGPPNNWLSVFGGDLAWEFDDDTGQWYLHNFLDRQPDLNWWNEEVHRAMDEVIRYWFDRGVSGFRVDVAHALVKDRELRDNPPATQSDHPHLQRIGQLPIYNMNRLETHDVLKRWRRLADAYHDPDRIFVGETYVLDVEQLAAFYGSGSDQLHMAFNFPFALADMDAVILADIVERTEALLPQAAWPAWTASNHDIGRLATRWGTDDERKTRCALMLLLTLRGTPFLYYGDEIGLGHVSVPFERLKDPVGLRYWPQGAGRDPCRTPMHWEGGDGAGFTLPGVEPWLPLGDASSRNVADQRSDPGSVLHLCRDLIALRRSNVALRSAPYADAFVEHGLWRYRRGDLSIVLNMGSEPRSVEGLAGRVAMSTTRRREGMAIEGPFELGAWEGAVIASPF
jgi:alpha-glucosidase